MSIEREAQAANMFLLAAMAVVIVIAVVGRWYWAGVQSEVYNRQGASMSRWEVFVGAKPAKVVTP